jgi:hypothetical protein
LARKNPRPTPGYFPSALRAGTNKDKTLTLPGKSHGFWKIYKVVGLFLRALRERKEVG